MKNCLFISFIINLFRPQKWILSEEALSKWIYILSAFLFPAVTKASFGTVSMNENRAGLLTGRVIGTPARCPDWIHPGPSPSRCSSCYSLQKGTEISVAEFSELKIFSPFLWAGCFFKTQRVVNSHRVLIPGRAHASSELVSSAWKRTSICHLTFCFLLS